MAEREGPGFSPYRSPVPRPDPRNPSQHNATGCLRKLKDVGADVHNTLEKWESLNSKGNVIISDLVNVKLEHIHKQNVEGTDEARDKAAVVSLSQRLEPQCEALQQVCQSMEELVEKLAGLVSVVRGLHSLRRHRGDADNIVGFSWTIHVFVATLEDLHAMYTKELSWKKEMCQIVAHSDTRESLMFYSAAWMHQPYINSERKVTALLMETGHLKVT